MRIDLMDHPWAANAAHTITAETLHQWRAAIASISPPKLGRFSAAMYLGDDPRPHAVQKFHGAKWPDAVVSGDGFLVIRVGIEGAQLAAEQWHCLTEFPHHMQAYDGFLGETRDLIRGAVYPPLRLVSP